MAVPAPRPPADDAAAREAWLQIAAQLWDYARPYSRSQLTHATTMMLAGHGGTVLVRLASKLTGRRVPEIGYVTEGFAFGDLGASNLP